MRLASLGSGSRGNATVIDADGTLLLVDCGFSVSAVQRRSRRLGLDPAKLAAILVTHEHSDHSSGVAALARRYDIPVYLTHGTLSSGRVSGCPRTETFNADSSFSIGPLTVHAIAVPHDAREPVQYRFEHDGRSIGVLTDLGSITPHVVAAFRSCDLLLLEFNHDRRMLATGPYPEALQRRVGGDWGHLSNTQAVELLQRLGPETIQTLVVGHVSEKNNSRAHVMAALNKLGEELLQRTRWATQEQGLSWFEAGERRLSSAAAVVGDAAAAVEDTAGGGDAESDPGNASLVSATTVGAY